MNKQQLSEALAKTFVVNFSDDLPNQRDADADLVEAAARLVERLLPGEESVSVPCPETWDPNISCPVNHFEMRRVWDEGMLDHIMEAASFRSRDTVIAVLSALVELLTEKVPET